MTIDTQNEAVHEKPADEIQTSEIGHLCIHPQGDQDSGYKNWSVLAGYLDGDGNLDELVRQFVVTITLGFTDNWDKQLLAVKDFLESHGVRAGYLTARKSKRGISAWQLRVCNVQGVLKASREMLPHAFKKKAELKGVVEYLENRITGDELIARVNHEVEIGNKMGKLKTSSLPYTLGRN
ncbi:MAG: hypothetical protein HYU03_05395 [Thaumarchaeota archaeon]|nr:hypothetical protein [Nitrososphaerota archaeon]